MGNKPKKTYKREVAAVLLAALGYTIWTGDHRMVEILVWPVVGFAGAAFGLDSVMKQYRGQ